MRTYTVVAYGQTILRTTSEDVAQDLAIALGGDATVTASGRPSRLQRFAGNVVAGNVVATLILIACAAIILTLVAAALDSLPK